MATLGVGRARTIQTTESPLFSSIHGLTKCVVCASVHPRVPRQMQLFPCSCFIGGGLHGHGSVCSSHVADGPSLPSRGVCFRPWCAAWPLTRCVADRDRSSARAGAGPRLVLVCYSVGEAFACRSGRPELVATNEWSRLAASHQAAGRQAGPCKKWDHDAARKAFFFLFGWT